MGTFIFIACIVIGVVIALLFEGDAANRFQQEKDTLHNRASSLPDFTPSMRVDGRNNAYTFMVDEQHRQICYMEIGFKKFYPFEKIMSVEILENGDTTFSKSTMRTVGGTLVGGVLGGGVGAVVGGLSGDSKMKKKIKTIQIKIGVRDISNPSFVIETFKDGYSHNILSYGQEEARQIVDVLNIIIDDVDHQK